MQSYPSTLGALKRSPYGAPERSGAPSRTSCARISSNRICAGGPLFAGVIGYEDTVMPQIVNALLSQHNFILLGLRGQAKSRILRALDDAARRRDADRRRQRSQRQSVRADLEVRAQPARRGGRRHADRVARSRQSVRREARDARRDDRRHHRRPRSDQGGARRPRARPTSSRSTTACCRARIAASSR